MNSVNCLTAFGCCFYPHPVEPVSRGHKGPLDSIRAYIAADKPDAEQQAILNEVDQSLAVVEDRVCLEENDSPRVW